MIPFLNSSRGNGAASSKLLNSVLHVALALLFGVTAQAQVSFTGTPYTQNFNTLQGTTNNTLNVPWTNNTTIPGWYSSKATYTVTDGTLGGSAAAFDSTSTAAQNVGLFSFGTAASAERAIGMRSTAAIASNTPIHVGVRLVNNTGAPITRVSFAYTGEQWFKSSTANNTFTLTSTYQLSATSLTSGTWTSANTTFTAPIVAGTTPTALDGNSAANRRGVGGSIGGLTWAPGQELWIRISDNDQAGEEHGLAIDDFVFWAEAGTAVLFNGASNLITMTAATEALGASIFTLECWFMRTGAGAATTTGGVTAIPLVAKGRTEADGSNLDCNYFLGIDAATGALCADFEAAPGPGVTAGANYPVFGATPVPMNVWTHAAATYDGTIWRIYLNGVQDGTSTPANAPQPRADSIQQFSVATAQISTGVPAGFFQGAIDEVRVWNIARTSGQIAGARNREIAAPLPGLLARYGFGEGSSIIASNSVPSGPNGALFGSPAWVSGPSYAANAAPNVTLTAPAAGGSAQEPASIALAATANGGDGEIAKVEFFAGANKIGEDVTAPYQLPWNSVPAGSYSLTARVTDDGGASATSAPVSFTVTANPNATPTITALAPAANAPNLTIPVTLQVALSDSENNPLTVKFYGRRATPAPSADFTLVTLPDTQFYSENLGGNLAAIYHSQTQWIVDQRAARNIAFVSHMGDIVQSGDKAGDPVEWLIADAAMARIENPASTLTAYGIPWGGAPGNHDLSPVGDENGTSVFYNQYFGTPRFVGRTYYGGRYGTTDNNNNYELFSVGGLDFIILHLAYRVTPSQAVIDWADALLKANPERRAIVTSHWIVNTGNPASWGGAGQMMYENLKDNPNLFMFLCGHVSGEGQRTDIFKGRAIYSLLQDYQGRTNGGDGWLRYYEFSPANNLIRARTYSTTLLQSEADADSDFTLPYDMQSAMGSWIELATSNVAGGGAGASYAWPGLGLGKEYEWYATASDGIHTATTPARRFNTRADAPPTIALTAPANNATFAPGATVALAATAADSDGTIARVEFFQGGTKLGEDTLSPYTFTWTGVPLGSYSVTAIARDNGGNAVLSPVVNVIVSSSGALTRGPYLNQANENSLVVRWRSSLPVTGRVRYGPSPEMLTQFADESAATTEHIVQLTGLSPYARYFYSIGSATDTLAGGDAQYTFRTSPIPGTATDTRIWVLGDCGRANANQAAVRNAYYNWTGARTPDLCLMLGDNAYFSGTQTEYDAAVFNMYPTFLRKMPLWSCLGNHDASNGVTDPLASFPYFDMFTFPKNGECGGVLSGTEHYFSFDYGNIHFINLDSQTNNRIGAAMMTWLQSDLASTTKTWIIAFFHHPPYSMGSHNSDSETPLIQMREIFGPVLEAGGVDLVLSGHSHCYERSFFIDGHYGASTTFTGEHVKQPGDGRPGGDGSYTKPLTGPRDHFGAVYTLAGSAGSADGGTLDHPAMYVSYNTLGSFNLDINGPRLDATYIESDNGITDTFTILKQGAADSDGDGIPDAYEITHGLDRHSAADATLDADGDGFTNLEEWVLGLLASTPDRYAWTVARTAPNITVTCSTQPGRTYRVWSSSDLQTWSPASPSAPGDGQNFVWIDDGSVTGGLPPGAGKRYYRVRVTVP